MAAPAVGNKEEQPGWVLSQQKVFTKWVNAHLAKAQPPGQLTDLHMELDTGINLIKVSSSLFFSLALAITYVFISFQLCCVLFSVPPPKYNKEPKQQFHCLDNIAVAMQMLEVAGVKTTIKSHRTLYSLSTVFLVHL